MGQTTEVKGRATSIRTEDGMTHIRYHRTDVVSFNEAYITLHSGGWRTVTTKTRMNQAAFQFGLKFNVFQKDFAWFVKLPNGKTVDFKERMTFNRA